MVVYIDTLRSAYMLSFFRQSQCVRIKTLHPNVGQPFIGYFSCFVEEAVMSNQS